jgi:hypothetical protein
LVTDTHSILARWRNHYSQLFDVHRVSNFKHTEIHTAEPLVPEPNAFEFEITVEKLKDKKLSGIEQIPAELIKAGGRTIHYEVYKLIIYICNKEELLEEWKESIIVPIYKLL